MICRSEREDGMGRGMGRLRKGGVENRIIFPKG